MPRRQRGGRKSKPREFDQPAPMEAVERTYSPVAKKVLEKIARGGERYLKKNIERVLIDSQALAEEPEFTNLYFDPAQTVRITERFLKKYSDRLAEAEKKSQDKFQQVYDEMRIDIIAELARPPFRKEVFRRMDALARRILATEDAGKIEIVWMLEPLLRMKDIPWGICGLIIAIYNRSFMREMQKYEEEDELVGEWVEEVIQGKDLAEVLAQATEPERVAAFTKKLEEKPGLRQRLERRIDEAVDQFEKDLFRGKIVLDVFTEEELSRPAERLSQAVETGQIVLAEEHARENAQRFFEIARASLVEIATPQRLVKLKADLEKISRAWLRERNKGVIALQAEIAWLDDIEPAENGFLIALYLGSVRRAIAQAARSAASPAEKEDRPRKGLRGLFRRGK